MTDQGFTGNHTLSYVGASTQIASDGTSTYSYDPAGNLVGIGVQGGTTSQGQIAYTDKHTDVVGAFTPSGTGAYRLGRLRPVGHGRRHLGHGDPRIPRLPVRLLRLRRRPGRHGVALVLPGRRTPSSPRTPSPTAPSPTPPTPTRSATAPTTRSASPTRPATDPSSGGGAGNVTKADVDAARSRMRTREQEAARAEANAKQAWGQAAEAQRAASQEANYARELNTKAGQPAGPVQQTQAKANAKFAKAARSRRRRLIDLGEASRDQETLNYLKQMAAAAAARYQAGESSGGGGSASDRSLKLVLR